MRQPSGLEVIPDDSLITTPPYTTCCFGQVSRGPRCPEPYGSKHFLIQLFCGLLFSMFWKSQAQAIGQAECDCDRYLSKVHAEFDIVTVHEWVRTRRVKALDTSSRFGFPQCGGHAD
ncbi:hypothetical protein FA13DRAFT_1724691 [Coprinellus micaceus]|uniref:Uncharacterized protein n=1 Tax=Coprinellus micaceus TaxID=71717 RepID=A0A4Y7TY56_COPMI|nr:hypothetical protein FA13DRAFT_1724691 [Coprinellus micaceus]